MPLSGDDDVALLEAAPCGRAVRHDFGDDRALGVLEAQARGDLRRRWLWICTPSQPRVTLPSCLELSAITSWIGLAGMAKPMPTLPPDGEKIAVFMPMTWPRKIEGRAAGIAAVDRRIDLDEVGICGCRRRSRPSEETMPAVTVPAEAERIADRDDPVADAQLAGRRRIRRSADRRIAVDLEQRDVGRRSVPMSLASKFAPVGQLDGDLRGRSRPRGCW